MKLGEKLEVEEKKNSADFSVTLKLRNRIGGRGGPSADSSFILCVVQTQEAGEHRGKHCGQVNRLREDRTNWERTAGLHQCNRVKPKDANFH